MYGGLNVGVHENFVVRVVVASASVPLRSGFFPLFCLESKFLSE